MFSSIITLPLMMKFLRKGVGKGAGKGHNGMDHMDKKIQLHPLSNINMDKHFNYEPTSHSVC